MPGGPIDGNALVLAAVQASVSGERLPGLAEQAQAYLKSRLPEYRRRYEQAYTDETQTVFFVGEGHWADICTDLDLDRRGEFETALEVREAAVIGTA